MNEKALDQEMRDAGFDGYVGCPFRACCSPYLCSERGDCRAERCPAGCDDGVEPWERLTLPKRREWERAGRPGAPIATLVACPTCRGIGFVAPSSGTGTAPNDPEGEA